jgi:phosphocarrier protein HPr
LLKRKLLGRGEGGRTVRTGGDSWEGSVAETRAPCDVRLTCEVIMQVGKAKVWNKEGLHLRKAAEVVHCAKKFKSKVTLRHRSELADAGSIVQLLLLGAGPHADLEVRAQGPDEKEAVHGIIEVFNEGAGI